MTPTQSTQPVNRIKCYVVSDVHLGTHDAHGQNIAEHMRRSNFKEFIEQIIQATLPGEQILLVLNGDILDINSSWYGLPVPWAQDRQGVEARFLSVLTEILDYNTPIIDALRGLLGNPLAQIIYTIGNHDYLLGEFPSGQALIKQYLMDGDTTLNRQQDPVVFGLHHTVQELELYIEHGHLLDPFNSYMIPEFPPLGEVINVAIVNELQTQVVKKLQALHYQPAQIDVVKERLAQIEFLRPLSLYPLWISKTSEQSQQLFHRVSEEQHTIEKVIQETILERVTDAAILEFFVNKLHLPAWLLVNIAKLVLKMPAIMPVLSYIISKLIRHNHTNDFQYQKALEIYNKTSAKLVVFGHTHKPSTKPLGHDGYYFNTGSWTPVVNFVQLPQTLPLQEEFVRREHCGALVIQRDLANPEAKTEFSLETTQSGFVGGFAG